MGTHLARGAVALTAALALGACGLNEGNGEGPAADPAATVTGADCVLDSPIRIGAALSLSGGAASYGVSQRNGLELAAAHLAADEGVRYELTIEDDASDPQRGTELFEGFVGDGMSLIIGPTLSTVAFQAQPIAQQGGTPVLAISNTATGITSQGDHIFRSSLTEAQVIPQTVAKAKEVYDLAEVVVMYSDDDAFTESGHEVFASALADEGVEVLDTLTFSTTDTDFRALLGEAAAGDPDALVVSALIEAAVPLVTQARELGIEVPILGGNGFNNPLLMTEAGPAAEGVVVGAAWNSASTTPGNTEFLAAYEEVYGTAPDQFAAQAYASLHLIDVAVRTTCSGERDAIRDGLGRITDEPTVLGTMSINADRDAEHEAVVQIVEGGRFVALD